MTQVVNLNQKILKIPMSYRIPLLVCSITCISVGLFIAFITKGNGWVIGLILFLAVALLTLILFSCFTLWKVEIKEDGLIYRNYFGRKKLYNFADLELREYSGRLKWFFIKDGKKVICIESIIKNNEALKDAYYKFLKKSKKLNRGIYD